MNKYIFNSLVLSVLYIPLLFTDTATGKPSVVRQVNDNYLQVFEKARYNYHRGCYVDAWVQFEDLVRQNPNHAMTFAYAGLCDKKLYLDPSEDIWRAKELINPDQPDYLFTRALLFYTNDEFEECERVLKKYLVDFPNDKYARQLLGLTQVNIGLPFEGLLTLNKLLKSEPDFYPAYLCKGYAHVGLGQYKDALVSFETFLRNDPNNLNALDAYAEGLASAGERDKAIAQLTKAVLMDSGYVYGWDRLGDLLIKTGNFKSARAAFLNAKKLNKWYGPAFAEGIDKKLSELPQ